jgi:cobalt-zinc-cadmium efflux system protein
MHSHVHAPVTGARLWMGAGLMVAFTFLELAIGWWANSLALISDAGHNLTDAAALVLSAWALGLAGRPADERRTFGFHRAGVLAALVNAATLIVLAVYIFYEGYHRLLRPEPVDSLPMMGVAGVGLLLNAGIALSLRHGHDDVNVRSALLHLVGDAIASAGVILAGAAIWLTGSSIWDPLVSVLIGGFIVWSSWGIVKETVEILMEGTPSRVHVEELVQDVESVAGVRGVHDLHVWALASNLNALSAHLVVEDPDRLSTGELVSVVRRVKQMLAERHGIAHATLETHCSDGDTDCLPCEIHPQQPHVHDHAGHAH